MIAVSECLIGRNCRYDGGSKLDEAILTLFERGEAICICSECLGGLPTPREPSEIEPGFSGEDVLDGRARVFSESGDDVTDFFLKGAEIALKVCVENGVTRAILKSESPSCGCGEIYDGTFEGGIVSGDGVMAAILKRHGIAVQCR